MTVSILASSSSSSLGIIQASLASPLARSSVDNVVAIVQHTAEQSTLAEIWSMTMSSGST